MDRTRRVLGGSAVVIMATAGSLVAAGRAEACSCAAQSARDAVANGEAVVIGRATGRADATGQFGAEWAWTVEIDEVLAGAVGQVIEVRTDAGGTTCGPVHLSGDPQGIVLGRDHDGRWSTGMCGGLWPADELRAAAGPLPAVEPGLAEAVAVTRWGPVRLLALDSGGEVVGYGAGESVPSMLGVCPGGARIVEAHAIPPGQIAVRDMATLAVVDGEPGATRGEMSSATVAVVCRDPEATVVEALVRDDATFETTWQLVRRTPADGGIVDLGQAEVMALDPQRSRVLAASGTVIREWDGATGAWRELAHLDDGALIVGLAVDADGAVAVVRGGEHGYNQTVDDVVLLGPTGAVLGQAAIGPGRLLDAVTWPGDGRAAVLVRGFEEDPGARAEVVRVDRTGTAARVELPAAGHSAVATSAGLLVTTDAGLVHVDPAGTAWSVGPNGEEAWSLAAVRPAIAMDAPPPPGRSAEQLAAASAVPEGGDSTADAAAGAETLDALVPSVRPPVETGGGPSLSWVLAFVAGSVALLGLILGIARSRLSGAGHCH